MTILSVVGLVTGPNLLLIAVYWGRGVLEPKVRPWLNKKIYEKDPE
jgi:hypothetical protein